MTEQPLMFVPEGFALGAVAAGRYRLRKFLGTGGSGFVVLAEDLHLDNNLVVLKFLHTHLIEDERAFQRFRNETSIAFELNHPNIAQTFSFERWEGVGHFITMEYLPAGSLLECLTEHTGPNFDFTSYCRRLNMIIQGLGYAHQTGIVHRDIKPHNLLLTAEHVVKIADFGLSQLMWGDMKMTHVGDMLGTPQYMSPEQLDGRAIDRRSDVYSLGITAFELACGQPPFQGKSLYELAEQHFSRPLPPLGEFGVAAPEWFEQFLIRCTQKSREGRFQSCEDAALYLVQHDAQCFSTLAAVVPSAKVRTDEAAHSLRNQFKRQLLKNGFLLLLAIAFFGLSIHARTHPPLLRYVASIFLLIEKYTTLKCGLLKSLYGINISLGDTHLFFQYEPTIDVWPLLYSGVNPNFRGAQGLTPLLWTAKLQVNFSEKHLQELIRFGADVEATDEEGRTALFYCVIRVWPGCAEIMLQAEASPNRSHKEGFRMTPLHYAVETRNLNMIELLLRYRADPNAPDLHLATPLLYAVKIGDADVVRVLLRHGALPDRKVAGVPDIQQFAQFLGDQSEDAPEIRQLLANPPGS